MSNILIVPAIVPQSLDDLHSAVSLVKDVARYVQVDVVDGHYAHGKTWPYRDSGTFAHIVEEEKGLPFWETLDFEFDLMINNPEETVMQYVQAGASRIIVHASAPGAVKALTMLVDLREEGGAFSIQAGVALGAHAQLDELEQFEAQFDFVQVMGVAKEGHQGEPFDQKALYLVERLHARYPQLPLQVDGGVNEQNIRELVTAGATRLAVGSAIVTAEDPAAAYKQLALLANSAA